MRQKKHTLRNGGHIIREVAVGGHVILHAYPTLQCSREDIHLVHKENDGSFFEQLVRTEGLPDYNRIFDPVYSRVLFEGEVECERGEEDYRLCWSN